MLRTQEVKLRGLRRPSGDVEGTEQGTNSSNRNESGSINRYWRQESGQSSKFAFLWSGKGLNL